MPNHTVDLAGQTFGLLTAVRPVGKSRRGVVWLVRCQCGKELQRHTTDLARKPRTKTQMPRSCGCVRKRYRSPKYKGCGSLSGSKWRGIKAKAKHRKQEFAITIEYAWQLFVEQRGLCALTGVQLALSPSSMAVGASSASLDRIDSSKGYIPGNVQWVHVAINYMKSSMSQSDFIAWCRLVAHHNPGVPQ